MSKYAEMSDTDINKLVAEKLGLKVLHLDDTAIPMVRCDDRKNKKSFYADYCNNPSDAWPIILENKIDITFDSRADQAEAGGGFYSSIDKNPLRAAMIVFLMMGDNDE